MVGAALRGARFDGARLDLCDFSSSDLTGGASFRAVHLSDCRLRSVRAAGADFRAAEIRESQFDAADLRGALFENAKLVKTSFVGADCDGADFSGADGAENKYWRSCALPP